MTKFRGLKSRTTIQKTFYCTSTHKGGYQRNEDNFFWGLVFALQAKTRRLPFYFSVPFSSLLFQIFYTGAHQVLDLFSPLVYFLCSYYQSLQYLCLSVSKFLSSLCWIEMDLVMEKGEHSSLPMVPILLWVPIDN